MAEQKKGNLHPAKTVNQANKFLRMFKSLSLIERKILYALVAQIDSVKDSRLFTTTFKYNDLCEELGIVKDRKQRSIVKAIENLQSLNYTERVEGAYEVWSLLESPSKIRDDGIVELTLHQHTAQYFLHLKQYTSFRLGELLTFSKQYTPAVYELLSRVYGEKKSPRGSWHHVIDYQEFREAMGLEPSTKPKTKYKQHGQFADKVLKPALEEISEKTNWIISWETKRRGRIGRDYLFTINPKKKRAVKAKAKPKPKQHPDPAPVQPEMFPDLPTERPPSNDYLVVLERLKKCPPEYQKEVNKEIDLAIKKWGKFMFEDTPSAVYEKAAREVIHELHGGGADILLMSKEAGK